MARRRRLFLSLLVLALTPGISTWNRLAAAPAGTVHLPDLHTNIPGNEILINQLTPTIRELRYTHETANIGDGPFEVRPQYDPATDSARGFQRLYTHDVNGAWSLVSESLVVGIFQFHAVHGHFHFPLVQFGLYREAPDGSIGPPVAMSAKVGFCIADSLQVTSLPHAGVFGYSGSGCSDPRTVRGISVAWADRYDWHDDGQSIDITNLPDGRYWFRALSDPFNYFVEKDETNNATDVHIQISGTSVSVIGSPLFPNSQPPAVSMTGPAAGPVAGANVIVSADASDASGITSLQFLLDGKPLGTPLSGPPFIIGWDTTAVADGQHDLSAQATAASGFHGTARPVIVTVSNNDPPPPPPPTPLYISNVFAGNRSSSSATITWTTNVPATSTVDYGLDSTYGTTRTDAALVTTHSVALTGLMAATQYHYRVTSQDAQLNSASAGDYVFTTAGVSQLSCTITAPLPGETVSGPVTISADSSGTASVLGVQFKVDGNNVGDEDTTTPYSIVWDTRTATNDVHSITAVARDPTNHTETCGPVTVTVYNAPPPPGSGLVAALAFNEGTGASAMDFSGSGNNGVVSGATWTDGRFGKALSFDGVNDLVTVADSPSLDLAGGMTLEAWVNARSVTGWRTVLLKERPGQLSYAIYGNTGTNRPSVEVTVGTSNVDVRAPSALTLNTWIHLAAVYDGATLRLYRDGMQVGSLPVTGSLFVSSNPLRIGGNLIWGEYFNGLIDEVRIYNRPLTQAELQADMNTPIGGTPPPDTTPPSLTNGQPSGTLPAGTTSATLQVTTDEGAVCRYAVTAQTPYSSMPNVFATSGGTAHSTPVSGLVNGSTYFYYVRCSDGAGNVNTADFVITFSIATPQADTTPPVRSNGQPIGTLPAGTTATSLQLATDENATCRYATTANTAYSAMPTPFATTGGTAHSTPVSGLANGATYTFYVRCADASGNANLNDFTIAFSVANVSGSGLVAAYGFNENAGTTVADLSGNGHTGAVSGATWIAGRFGSALLFDGMNDVVTVGDSNLLDLMNTMTIEAWVYPRALSGWRTILLKERPSQLAYALYDQYEHQPAERRNRNNHQHVRGASPIATAAVEHLDAPCRHVRWCNASALPKRHSGRHTCRQRHDHHLVKSVADWR